jgi:hypothetical protein
MSETRPKYGKNGSKFTQIDQKVKISIENEKQFHDFVEIEVRQWFMNREFGKVEISCHGGNIKVSRTDWISYSK